MAEHKYLPTIHYIVTTAYDIELPGPDKKYVDIIGSYESMEDAKQAINENVELIMDNDKQYLSLYKVNLEDCKVYDFYRKDLKDAVKLALEEQKEKDEEHFRLSRIVKSVDDSDVQQKSTSLKGNFPRPIKRMQAGSAE